MMKIITIIKIFYLYYFFRIFKTKYSFSHPFEFFLLRKINNFNEKSYFNHIIENTKEPIKRICPFGQQIILVLMTYILIRDLMINKNKIKYIDKIVFYITLILSLLNFNAFIYLIPFWISECLC